MHAPLTYGWACAQQPTSCSDEEMATACSHMIWPMPPTLPQNCDATCSPMTCADCSIQTFWHVLGSWTTLCLSSTQTQWVFNSQIIKRHYFSDHFIWYLNEIILSCGNICLILQNKFENIILSNVSFIQKSVLMGFKKRQYIPHGILLYWPRLKCAKSAIKAVNRVNWNAKCGSFRFCWALARLGPLGMAWPIPWPY